MDDYQSALRENIWKLYAIEGFNGAMLVASIIVLFFQAHGLSLQQVFLVQSAFSIAIITLEIPSGYLSDRWGRSNTIIAGSAIYVIAWLTYSLGTSFWGFIAAEILLAVGHSFHSGTTDALAYDTLLELQEEKKYRAVSGHQLFVRFLAEAAGGIVGGLLALISLRAPFWATLVPVGIAFVIALTLTEPKRHKLQEGRHIKAMWDIFTRTIIHKIPLRSVIVLHGIISMLTLSMFWFTQPYQIKIGLPLVFFGLAHTIIVIGGAISAKFAHRATKWMDDRLILGLIALVVVGSYIAIGFTAALWGLLFFLFVRIAWGFLTPTTNDLINRMTTSDIRATTLSIKQVIGRILFATISPFFGYLADIYTINQAILFAGVLGGVALVITFVSMRRVWKDIPR